MAAFGAPQPVADDAAYGRRCPTPVILVPRSRLSPSRVESCRSFPPRCAKSWGLVFRCPRSIVARSSRLGALPPLWAMTAARPAGPRPITSREYAPPSRLVNPVGWPVVNRFLVVIRKLRVSWKRRAPAITRGP